ncbi:U3 small nucleolar RNA-interacting protein 2 [Fasciolopsis buskii]|uniref:U3 small nucleolar RNA-interacting protein 2 n=1 Tax=Fasciolopsis buskii TaxID=27845 RepID=A0A8E0VN51_9TREM|nr:U3 small nucleolar RNA-interacting protein 2 [Fasciolopsis buski]
MNVKYGSRKKQSLRQKKRVPLFCFNNVLVGSDDEKLESLSLRLREEALSAKGKFVVKVAEKCKPLHSDDVLCLKSHKRAVSCVCVSEDCSLLFSGGKDSNIIKWDIKTLEKLVVIRGGLRGSNYAYHTGPILSMAISSDSKYLASSSMDESVIIWDPASLKVLMKLKRHQAAVTVTVLTVLIACYLRLWPFVDTRICFSPLIAEVAARTNIEVLGLYGLTAERCVSCSGIGAPGICLWKVPEEVCVQYNTKDPLQSAVECVYAVNDEIFVGGSSSNKLYVWHSSRGSPVFTVSSAHPVPQRLTPGPEESQFRRPIANWVSAIAGLTGTDLIATGSTTGHVQLWRVVLPGQYHGEVMSGAEAQQSRTQIRLERLSGCSLSLMGFINSLAFTSDRRYLVVGLGQEHRLGKWEPRRPIDSAVCLVPLQLPFR